MNIVVDCRETGLMEQFKTLGVDITSRGLAIGDIILEQEKEILLFERKTIEDLASSIVDGRYKEQSCRLSEHGLCKHHIIYVLEGSISAFHASKWKSKTITKQTILSAITSLFYYKGFSVMRTENLTETAELIAGIRDKILKENKSPFLEQATDYISTVKSIKHENITPDNIDVLMLSQIPYVSTSIAKVLLGSKTMAVFTQELQANPTMMDKTLYNERKLSKKVIQNIKTFLKINV